MLSFVSIIVRGLYKRDVSSFSRLNGRFIFLRLNGNSLQSLQVQGTFWPLPCLRQRFLKVLTRQKSKDEAFEISKPHTLLLGFLINKVFHHKRHASLCP